MNNLTIIEQQGKYLVDSREVATMVGKRHADLLETIKGYVLVLTNGEFRSLDFFIENTYKDTKGEVRPCYFLTRKGCDMVANKMTGEKGVLFTATYVTEFERMTEQGKSKVISQAEADAITKKYALDMSMIATEYSIKILRPSQASQIKMLTTVHKNFGLATNTLPSYTEEAETRSATELLEAVGSPMSTITFNKRLVSLGLLEVKTRNGKGNTKKSFKSLTDEGLFYGKNLVSPMNERETQAHFYPMKFKELLRLAVGA